MPFLAMVLLTGFLLISQETVRRNAMVLLAAFLVLPVLMTPLWLSNHLTWFVWAKTYSTIAAVLWIYLLRYVFPQNLAWPKYLMYAFLGLNIFESVLHDFQNLHYYNALAGLLVMLTLSPPSKISVNQSGKFKDLQWDLSYPWIVGYTLWNFVFTTVNFPATVLIFGALLLAPLVVAVLDRKIWAQARVFTLGIFLLINSSYRPLLYPARLPELSLWGMSENAGLLALFYMLVYTVWDLSRRRNRA